MTKITENVREVIIVTLICLLGFALRFTNYAEFPVVGETADEYAWTFLGSSLINQGIPASWSYFDAYEDFRRSDLILDSDLSQNFPFVQPVFDHPPLFGLIPGIAHTIRYANWYEVPSAKVIRFPMLLLGTLNISLLYVVAKRISKSSATATITALVFATAPHFVFASRLVVAENALVTVALLTMLVTSSSRSIKKLCIEVGILSAVGVLLKMSGVIIGLGLLMYGIATKQLRLAIAAAVGTLSGFALFALYGAWYNWELFSNVLLTQSTRGFGLLTLINRWFFHSAIVDKFYSDGWFFIGLSAVLVSMLFHKSRSMLLPHLLLVLNMIFIAFFVGEQTYHGWYDFLLIPTLTLAIGLLFTQILTDKKYLVFGFIWLLLLPMFRYLLLSLGVLFNLNDWIIRFIIIIGFIPYGVSLLTENRWPQRLAIALLSVIFLANCLTVLFFAKEAYWATDDTILYRGYIYPDTSSNNEK